MDSGNTDTASTAIWVSRTGWMDMKPAFEYMGPEVPDPELLAGES